MQNSNKNQSNLGGKKSNQQNQKPLQTPGSQEQEGKDRKFTSNSDIKHPEKKSPTQQDRSTKR